MVRTVKLKLLISQEDDSALTEVSSVYNKVCDFVSNYVFENGFELNFMSLQKKIYNTTRDLFGLNSQMTISAFKTVTARYKTVKEQLRTNPLKFRDPYTEEFHIVPRDLFWLRKPLSFQSPQACFVRSRNYRILQDGKLSLTGMNGTIKAEFVAPPKFHERVAAGWELGTATLIRRKKTWYLCVPMKSPEEEKMLEREEIRRIVGIDRGLINLLCVADSEGKTTFYSGRKIVDKRNKYAKTRRELQTKHTRSARKKLKSLEQRENRWMTDINHVLSKALVERYGAGTLFVLEDLKGVSFDEKNLRRRKSKSRRNLSSWAFYQFEQFFTYKAEANGSRVLKVPAKYTSQRCPKCGVVDKNQRNHDTHEYRCRCGFRTNDDRVGALNLLELGRRFIAGDENPKFIKSTTIYVAT